MGVCARYVRHLGAPRAGHRSTPPAKHLRGRGVRGATVPGRAGLLAQYIHAGCEQYLAGHDVDNHLERVEGQENRHDHVDHVLHGHACVERRHEEVRDAGDHDGEDRACDHARKRARARAAACVDERGGNDERAGREHAHGCAERVEEDARQPRDDGDRSAQLGPEGERRDEADDARGIVHEPRRRREDWNLNEAQEERRGGEKGRKGDLFGIDVCGG